MVSAAERPLRLRVVLILFLVVQRGIALVDSDCRVLKLEGGLPEQSDLLYLPYDGSLDHTRLTIGRYSGSTPDELFSIWVGISHSACRRTHREPLDSLGSHCCSRKPIRQLPMRKQMFVLQEMLLQPTHCSCCASYGCPGLTEKKM